MMQPTLSGSDAVASTTLRQAPFGMVMTLMVSLLIAMVAATCIEWGLSKAQRPKQPVKAANNLITPEAQSDGFLIQADGGIQASKPNASIRIPVDGAYIALARVYFAKNPNTPIRLEIQRQGDSQPIVMERSWQKRLDRTPYRFMEFAEFNINAPVSSIVIHAERADTFIAGIVTLDNRKYNLHRLVSLVAGLAVLLFAGLQVVRRSADIAPTFLLLALLTGGVIVLSTPYSLSFGDEGIHYRLTDRLTFKSVVPPNASDVFARPHVLPNSYSTAEQDQINHFFDSLPAPTSTTHRGVTRGEITGLPDVYHAIGHIPPALGLLTGRLLDLPNHITFKLGRLFNLAFYSLIVFCAIRTIPQGKLLVATIALLPTPIFLASHYSYDPWLTSFSFLGLASFMKALQPAPYRVTLTDASVLIGSLFLAVGPKAVYCVLLLPLLLIPQDRFASQGTLRRFRFSVVACFIVSLASFVLPFLIDGPGKGDSRGGAGVDSTGQVHYILSHPIQYAFDLVQFSLAYVNPFTRDQMAVLFFRRGMITGYEILLACVGVALFVRPAIEAERPIHMPVLIRGAILSACAVVIGLIGTALYIAFTPVGHHTINGVQARYIVPLVPFILIALTPVFPTSFLIRSNRIGHVLLAVIALIGIYGAWTNMGSLNY